MEKAESIEEGQSLTTWAHIAANDMKRRATITSMKETFSQTSRVP